MRHHNVLRIDHHYFHGWLVAVKRDRRTHEKYFRDAAYGGRRAALAEAIRYRDDLLAKLTPLNKFHSKSSVNTTGVIGVSHSVELTRAGNLAERYRAMWFTATGERRSKTFSVDKYGDAKAFALAVRARKSGVAQALRERRAMGPEKLYRKRR